MDMDGAEGEATPGLIEFARWETVVERDELTLTGLTYVCADTVTYPEAELAVSDLKYDPSYALQARFLSRQKQAIVNVTARNVRAFRVLDEGGLVDIWTAARQEGGISHSTFRVRGHGWQTESELEWLMEDAPGGYSYLIATPWQCLELVCRNPPEIEIAPAIIRLPH
ncbi:hypothetical protein [Sphingobium sp.]|uniref:hypothetical protein n=1 Tax=Sphingobium sp. TaxID=1912891 RepID=UPI002634FD40|nr:hypothetical protein [Sphingobium sp.]